MKLSDSAEVTLASHSGADYEVLNLNYKTGNFIIIILLFK